MLINLLVFLLLISFVAGVCSNYELMNVKKKNTRCQWFTPGILATLEAKIRRIEV
jgi:hypothetical protein